jgi:hypothetical protein
MIVIPSTHNTLKGDFTAPKHDPAKRSRQSVEPNHREQKTGHNIFLSQTFQSLNSLKSLVEGSDSAFENHSHGRPFIYISQ